jgi:uncharacterized phage infection (PIP) family protein YhgE
METLINNKREIKHLEELHKSLVSLSSEIKGLQHQATGIDKALSKLADNQATLLSMFAAKPQGPPAIGMNAINIAANTPLSFEETYNELIQYTDLLAPLLLQCGTFIESSEEKENFTCY